MVYKAGFTYKTQEGAKKKASDYVKATNAIAYVYKVTENYPHIYFVSLWPNRPSGGVKIWSVSLVAGTVTFNTNWKDNADV